MELPMRQLIPDLYAVLDRIQGGVYLFFEKKGDTWSYTVKDQVLEAKYLLDWISLKEIMKQCSLDSDQHRIEQYGLLRRNP